MKKKNIEKLSDRIVNAFLKNKLINPLPIGLTKKLSEAQKFRKLCESKIKDPIIGFKAAGTGIPVMKKLREKEPFYASVFKRNFIKSGKKVKINKATLGIELEVCFLIKKKFFDYGKKLTNKNIKTFISFVAPCIEIVGYRQKKKGITSFGDLCSDFGANIKFLIGRRKKLNRINTANLKTNIRNTKAKQNIYGNTNTVFVNPLNSLKFVLNKLKKDKIKLNKDFYVFTGSTIGVVPIKNKGLYVGKIDKLGIVRAIII